MSWAKVDDRLHGHPKARKAGPAAMGLWVMAMSHCMAYLTDGKVTRDDVESLVGRHADGHALATKLVEIGLWESEGENYCFHDWHKFQTSAKDIKREREKARKRKEKSRDASQGMSRGMSRRDSGRSSGEVRVPNPNPNPNPNPSPKEESKKEDNATPSAAGFAPTDTHTSPEAKEATGVQIKLPVDTTNDAGKVEPKAKKRKAQPLLIDETPPAEDTEARAVYDAIVQDPFLSPIVTGPAEFARRVAHPDAFPGVMVASEIRSAAERAVTKGLTYKDGNAYLRNWLKNSLAAVQRKPGSVSRPAAEDHQAFDVKAALEAFDAGLGTETPVFASPAEQAALRSIAEGSSPKVEVDDFRILGRAVKAGVCLHWCQPVTISMVVKHLSAEMSKALAWDKERRDKLASHERDRAAEENALKNWTGPRKIVVEAFAASQARIKGAQSS